MKLVRFGAPGAEKPGLVDADGTIRDVSAHVSDFNGANLSPAALDKLRTRDKLTDPGRADSVQQARQLHRRPE